MHASARARARFQAREEADHARAIFVERELERLDREPLLELLPSNHCISRGMHTAVTSMPKRQVAYLQQGLHSGHAGHGLHQCDVWQVLGRGLQTPTCCAVLVEGFCPIFAMGFCPISL